MNNTNTSVPFKPILLNLIFILLSTVGFAQKLPQIQEVSIRIPQNIKIDGQATEWNNKFQAYNKSTELFYTIANDDEKIYLVVHATDPLVVRKIIAGSITFTINPIGEKKPNNNVAITYPIFNRKDWPNINLRNRPVVTKDSTISSKQIDSFIYVINKQLAAKSKEIKVSGIKDIDTLISVYNETGIKAVSLFDHSITYTYELSIPLKYLAFAINNHTSFNYDIKLNGSNNVEGVIVTHNDGETHMQWYTPSRPTDAEVNFMEYPTDLSGTYILAKK